MEDRDWVLQNINIICSGSPLNFIVWHTYIAILHTNLFVSPCPCVPIWSCWINLTLIKLCDAYHLRTAFLPSRPFRLEPVIFQVSSYYFVTPQRSCYKSVRPQKLSLTVARIYMHVAVLFRSTVKLFYW